MEKSKGQVISEENYGVFNLKKNNENVSLISGLAKVVESEKYILALYCL